MKKTFTALLVVALLIVITARAGWVAAPLDVQVITPTLSETVTATGTVSVAALPAATQRYIISVSSGAILPAAPDHTATLVRISQDGATTNTYAFTNGAATASAGVWADVADTVTLTLSESVTNLPVIAYTYIASPTVTNITCYAGDQWQLCGARPSSAILPAGATNTLSVNYTGGASETLATFGNGGAAYLPAVPVWLSLFDTVTLTAVRCTNSPSFRIPRLRWID